MSGAPHHFAACLSVLLCAHTALAVVLFFLGVFCFDFLLLLLLWFASASWVAVFRICSIRFA